MKVVTLTVLRTGHPYPQEIFSVLISVRGCLDPRAIVRTERIEPATFRIVAQCLYQLRHCESRRHIQLFMCNRLKWIKLRAIYTTAAKKVFTAYNYHMYQ